MTAGLREKQLSAFSSQLSARPRRAIGIGLSVQLTCCVGRFVPARFSYQLSALSLFLLHSVTAESCSGTMKLTAES
jgi:hypothetical protein